MGHSWGWKKPHVKWGDPWQGVSGRILFYGLFNLVYLVMVEQKTYFKPPNRKELARS
jgi:hypothetical protein